MEHQPLSIDELIEQVEQQACSADLFYPHYLAGTLGVFYQQTITGAVEKLMMIPIYRLDKGLPTIEESDIVAGSLTTLATLIANIVGKSPSTVEKDMMQALDEFPADDIRQSTYLRHQNRLN